MGSSSGFNVKLLHDWSNFDFPKRMPEEDICLMPASCLSLLNTREDGTAEIRFVTSGTWAAVF